MKTNRLILLLGAAVLAAGCEREPAGVRAYSAPKEPPPPAPTVAAAAAPGKITWTAPEAWKPVEPGRMTYAAYQVSDNPPLKLTISQVSPMATPADTVRANVDRWNNQLGLPPTSEADLAKVVTPITLDGHESQLIDLAGPNPSPDGRPPQRILGALVPDGATVWAFKLAGPDQLVAPQKPAFAALIQSVSFGGAPGTPAAAVNTAPEPASPARPTAPPAPATPSAAENAKIPGLASFTLPQGWQVDPNQRPMRQGTILVRAGDEQAEIVVSQLNATSLLNLKANLDRWRGQVHLTPTDDAAANPPQEIAFAQGPGLLRDFVGPESDGPARKRQLVAMTQFPKAEQVWFFRFIGPDDLVAKNKPAFHAFVKSVKFDDK